jgi:hypothetical protein
MGQIQGLHVDTAITREQYYRDQETKKDKTKIIKHSSLTSGKGGT